jgi:23S rRNA (cytidine1920-2'-O)/16S rRNA (cytidine1409-2'-O)-methyltransferase
MRGKRLDRLLVERGLVENRDQAQRFVMAGEVRVDGQLVLQPDHRVSADASITLVPRPPFVSRGGQKLDAALTRFDVAVGGRVAADVGASTGGFTDCLLQRGASSVYAIDVGYGQLDWGLRNDPRVVVMERANARHLERLPEPVDLVTIDVSFISLELILPAVVGWLRPGGQVLALIKPQFEAQRRQVEPGGVVRDRVVHRAVLERVIEAARSSELALRGLMPSPLRGPAGNVEFLAIWRLGGQEISPKSLIVACLEEVGAQEHE